MDLIIVGEFNVFICPQRAVQKNNTFIIPKQILCNRYTSCSVTRRKSPNVYKSCPKMISLEKIKDFDTFTKNA